MLVTAYDGCKMCGPYFHSPFILCAFRVVSALTLCFGFAILQEKRVLLTRYAPYNANAFIGNGIACVVARCFNRRAFL